MRYLIAIACLVAASPPTDPAVADFISRSKSLADSNASRAEARVEELTREARKATTREKRVEIGKEIRKAQQAAKGAKHANIDFAPVAPLQVGRLGKPPGKRARIVEILTDGSAVVDLEYTLGTAGRSGPVLKTKFLRAAFAGRNIAGLADGSYFKLPELLRVTGTMDAAGQTLFVLEPVPIEEIQPFLK